MDKKLMEQLLELSKRFEEAKAFDTFEKEALLKKYLGELDNKASDELKHLSTEFEESTKKTSIEDQALSRISTEAKIKDMILKAKQAETENNFDIKSQADKPLSKIEIPGEQYNKHRTEYLELMDDISKILKISGKSPQAIGNEMVDSIVEDMGNFIALEDRHLLNPDGSKHLTNPEFQRLQLAASRIGLELEAENVKGDKGDKINILLDSKLKASINVTFSKDDVGGKGK